MPRFRMHTGSLFDSLATTIEVADRSVLIDHIRQNISGVVEFSDDDLEIKPYGDDHRIDWKDQHVVSIVGQGVIGMCEGPMEKVDI